ncbi:Oxygen-dependent choline dehydrogenase [Bordetella tumbae]|uniref:GMC family oxidoreductase n=1 Tax=Bordetella tumbae TaxID=1649139 RepID=UPI0039F08DC7
MPQKQNVKRSSEEFDFIVIGAGSAGAIVASRLSEDGRFSVLVLEAGGWDRSPWIHIPLGVGKTIMNRKVNWAYETEPQAELAGRRIYMARGKVIGGSGAINGMVHIRGHRQDFDGWADSGCNGWHWDGVLPYFRKSEDHYLGENEMHGTGGPVAVSKPTDHLDICSAFIESGANWGLPRNDDFNAGTQEGIGHYDLTVRRGLRSNSAKGALRPARDRRNLSVEVNACVQRILFDNHRAVGLEYRHARGASIQARARREIVLCSGAVNTPQLLMLSGIGPAQHLESIGINALADRTQVGRNLQDHLAVRVICRTRQPITLNDQLSSWRGKAAIGAKFLFQRRGPLTFATGQTGMFFKTQDTLPFADAQAFFMPFSTPGIGKNPHRFSAFSVSVSQCWPTSRGHIELRDANPHTAPAIQPNYLSTATDQEFYQRALPMLREVLATDPIESLILDEYQPGATVTSPADILRFVREKASTIYHPCGTCRMGNDADAVVDTRLRVLGIDGLRIADASIMPRIISGNINAACLMIGEKAADMILADHS